MTHTILLGTPAGTWRSHIKANHSEADLIRLDPADADFGCPGTLSVVRNGRPIIERFYGSIDAQRAPHLMLSFLIDALQVCKSQAVIQAFPYQSFPVVRQSVALLLHHARGSSVQVSPDFPIDGFSWPVPPQETPQEKSLPRAVQSAQRKSRWIEMLQKSHEHRVDLRTCVIEGTRLGSGTRLDEFTLKKLGLEGCYAERSGATLFLVTDQEIEDRKISRAMDFTHATRIQFATQDQYDGLLCAFAKPSGEEFGYGLVESIDFVNMVAQVRCSAIPPVPVPVLRLGAMRVTPRGDELGELKPWTI